MAMAAYYLFKLRRPALALLLFLGLSVHVGDAGYLKRLRKKLQDESYSTAPAEKRTEETAAILFKDRHKKVTNIIFVWNDLVGSTVPLHILRR